MKRITLLPHTFIPHIRRLLPASLIFGLHLVLWIGLVSLFVINIYARTYITTDLSRSISALLGKIYLPQTHISLAQVYFKLGYNDKAKNELTFVQNSSKNVLGLATSVDTMLTNLYQEEKSRRDQLAYWQTLVMEKPDYRDGYIMLAALSYEQSLFSNATSYIQKAQQLDPNYEIIQKFLRLPNIGNK